MRVKIETSIDPSSEGAKHLESYNGCIECALRGKVEIEDPSKDGEGIVDNKTE
tara:strand:+ start:425 stop:583 length:159 start_codon:yes stop_codon:yes gene_type:complete